MSRTTTDVPDQPVEPWEQEPEDEGRGTLLEVVLTIGAALLLAFLVQQYLVKPFKIPSGSMENTLKCGDRVLVDRISYRFSDPARKDVVVFHPPAGIGEGGQPDPALVADEGDAARIEADGTRTVTKADTNYIKRIIGLPGDEVEVKDHHAWVNGKELSEPYLRPIKQTAGFDDGSRANWGPKTVPRGTYLMLGDHRDNSADGRVFGFVPREFIIGKAFVVYWPLKRFGGLPDEDPGGAGATKADPNCLESAVPEGQTLEQDG
jgi:signal peptidase I